jgi:hypothetical protein
LPYLTTIVASVLTATDEDRNNLASELDHQYARVLIFAGMPEGPLIMGSLMMGSLMVEEFSVSKPGTSIGFMLLFAIV